mmetsp:Transcript_66161/g.159663  ORF Transcript_66161/g.159663 Transcript_66161/m.159663 type:complete len:218 (-) Transcript_66161:122-775(-)
MSAAQAGKLDCLEHLIAKGANLNAQNIFIKQTALHYAAKEGHAPCFESLLEAGADASLENKYGKTALDHAKTKDHTKVVQLLEDPAAYFAAQVIHIGLVDAAREGNLDLLKQLTNKGVNAGAADSNGLTALMWAATKGKVDCVDHLITEGASLDAQSTKGKNTALHLAAYFGHPPCVASLLNAKADPSLKNADGKTALDRAKDKEHPEVIKMLDDLD